jgi:type VI secretion system protein ImpG
MFSRHYQSELDFLHGSGSLFADAHPSTAGMLGFEGGDPDVHRLLEGFAFLCARIRERVDQEIPYLAQELCNWMLPHYSRPIPACTILQYLPDIEKISQPVLVEEGREVVSVPVGGTSCIFRTSFPVSVLPLKLENAVLDDPYSSSPRLRLSYRIGKNAHTVFTSKGIRLYLHGEFTVATTLWLWFQRHCQYFQVRYVNEESKQQTINISSNNIVPVGLRPEHALLPWPRMAPDCFRYLQEYFALPQKFLFIDLQGLEKIPTIPGGQYEFSFCFDKPPELPGHLSQNNFKLFCTPAINLFTSQSLPVSFELPGQERLLCSSEFLLQQADIYSVDSVIGTTSNNQELQHEYAPFFDFEYTHSTKKRNHFYRIRQDISTDANGLDSFISIYTPRDVIPSLEEQSISARITCTNRSFAGLVRAGDIHEDRCKNNQTIPFQNILGATPAILPPTSKSIHWRLAVLMALKKEAFQEATAFKTLLNLYNFHSIIPAGDSHIFQGNRNRIQSIQFMESVIIRRNLDRCNIRGIRINLELEEACFACKGEAFLFGSILNELFAYRVAINSFNETKVRLQPSRTEYSWPMRNGCQELI